MRKSLVAVGVSKVVGPFETSPERYIEKMYNYELSIVSELRFMITDRDAELAKVSFAISSAPGSYGHSVSWGVGIENDLIAVYAKEALDALEHRPMREILEFQRDRLRRMQRDNAFFERSTSSFHNGVAEAKGNVARRYGESLEGWINVLDHYRALGEIL